MSKQRVIAEIRAQGAKTRAFIAESHAETRAEIAVIASRIDAHAPRLAASDSRLESMGWAMYATVALVTAIVVARILTLIYDTLLIFWRFRHVPPSNPRSTR